MAYVISQNLTLNGVFVKTLPKCHSNQYFVKMMLLSRLRYGVLCCSNSNSEELKAPKSKTLNGDWCSKYVITWRVLLVQLSRFKIPRKFSTCDDRSSSQVKALLPPKDQSVWWCIRERMWNIATQQSKQMTSFIEFFYLDIIPGWMIIYINMYSNPY